MGLLSPSGRVNISPETDVFLAARGKLPHSPLPRRLPSLSKCTSLPILPRHSHSAIVDSPTPKSRLSPPVDSDITDRLPPRRPLLSSISVPNFSKPQTKHPARKYQGRARRGALENTSIVQPSPAIIKTRSMSSPQLWSFSGMASKPFPGSVSIEEGFRIASQPAPRVANESRPILKQATLSSVVSAPVVDWARMKAEHAALKGAPVHRDVLLDGITERTRHLSLGPPPVDAVRAANARRGVVGAIRPSRSLHSLPSASPDHSNAGGSSMGTKAEFSMTLQNFPNSLPVEFERDEDGARNQLSSTKSLAIPPSKSLSYAVRPRSNGTSPSLLRVNRRISPVVEEEPNPGEGAELSATATFSTAPIIKLSVDEKRSQAILRPPLAKIYFFPTLRPGVFEKGIGSSSIPRPLVKEQYDDDDSDKENNWRP